MDPTDPFDDAETGRDELEIRFAELIQRFWAESADLTLSDPDPVIDPELDSE